MDIRRSRFREPRWNRVASDITDDTRARSRLEGINISQRNVTNNPHPGDSLSTFRARSFAVPSATWDAWPLVNRDGKRKGRASLPPGGSTGGHLYFNRNHVADKFGTVFTTRSVAPGTPTSVPTITTKCIVYIYVSVTCNIELLDGEVN